MPSVVIPAHDEAGVLPRCLDSVLAQKISEDPQVVVVCNGCSDHTAQVARSFPGVRVVETDRRSKTNALNLGEEVVDAFPRMFLDADVVLEPGALARTFAALKNGVLAASPAPRFILDHSSIGVRMFYRAWRRMPFYNRSMIGGSGAYALSREGRGRFDQFPELISDDGYVRLQFASHERKMVEDAHSQVRCPATTSALLDMMTRVDAGIMELRETCDELISREENRSADRIIRALRRPWLAPCFLVYASVRVVARRRAGRLRDRCSATPWIKDASSRIEEG